MLILKIQKNSNFFLIKYIINWKEKKQIRAIVLIRI